MMDHLDIACDIEIKEEPLEEHGKKIKLESEFSSADDTQSEESSVLSKKIKLETKKEGSENDSGAIFSQVGILKSVPQEFEEYQIQQQENLSEEKNYELQIQLQNCLTNGATKFEEQREVDNERASSSNVNPKVWSHKQTLLLLASLKKQKELYVCSQTRNQAFINIHKKFIEHSHPFSIDDIKRKWRNITRTYRTTRDKCRHTGEGKQTWPYYEMVHEICEYKGSGEITASELALMDTFLEDEKSTPPSDIETHRVKQFPTSTLSCKRRVLKPCSEVCFKEYALESSKLLKTISENMDKISDSMTEVKKSLDENTLTMNRLCSTMERFINGVIVRNHSK